jgi:hypothetical protein
MVESFEIAAKSVAQAPKFVTSDFAMTVADSLITMLQLARG